MFSFNYIGNLKPIKKTCKAVTHKKKLNNLYNPFKAPF